MNARRMWRRENFGFGTRGVGAPPTQAPSRIVPHRSRNRMHAPRSNLHHPRMEEWMISIHRPTLFALAIAAMPAVALAEDAFTMQQTDIYAGPSSEFPQIASLPPNTEVGVAGCLSDWSWCDVTFSNARGWVWAGDLGYPYESRRVAIIEFGPRLRLPVVTFSINTYWDAHYRSRSFYRERSVWVSRVHVEGGHGGTPPHGSTRVARPEGGAQPAPTARAGQPQQGQPTQGMQRQREESAQRQADQRSREETVRKAQTEERA